MQPNIQVQQDFESLKEKLISERDNKLSNEVESEPSEENASPTQEIAEERALRKFLFQKGEQQWELDEDAEIEITADKGIHRLTLKELKDRAAGGIAVKQRMHQLAEEKKKLSGTFEKFAEMSKSNPIRALEYLASKAHDHDEDFEFQDFVNALAEQAESLTSMTPEQRENAKLKEQLEEAEEVMTKSDLLQMASDYGDRIMYEYGLDEDELGEMIEAVTEMPELLEGIESQEEIFQRVEQFAQETRNQERIYSALLNVNPRAEIDDPIIQVISKVFHDNEDLVQDFTDEDIQDLIANEMPVRRKVSPTQERRSYKARQSQSIDHISERGLSDYQILMRKLNEEKINKPDILRF
jgi:hypothetical protein